MITAFLEYLSLEKKYSVHTITAYKNDLISFRDFLEIEYAQENLLEVHYPQIRSWIVTLVDTKISNRTINRKVSSLKSFYKFLQKTKQIDGNPLSKHKALKTSKKIQVPFSQAEVNSVLNDFQFENTFEGVRDKLIIELFYSTGIRRIELVSLKLSDLDLANKTIKVLGKRNKERILPLLNSTVEVINEYVLKRNKLTNVNDNTI